MSIYLGRDVAGTVDYSRFPATYRKSMLLLSGAEQHFTMPGTDYNNIPWQVLFQYRPLLDGTATGTWVAYTPRGATLVTAAAPTGAIADTTSELEPAMFTAESFSQFSFYTENTSVEVGIVWYAGAIGNY